MQAARELWAAACRRFLRCEDGGGAKSDKVHRASTYWWLMSIDHALRILTGHEQLAADGSPLSADARQHLADSLGADWPRRRLSVVADQCVVGVSAMTYADQVLGIKAGLIAGMPHRRWNSEKTRSLPAEGGGRSSSPQFFQCRLRTLVVSIVGRRFECGASRDVPSGRRRLPLAHRLVAGHRQG